MSNPIVKCHLESIRGSKISGPSGTLYYVSPKTSLLHEINGEMPDPEAGCKLIDAKEYMQFPSRFTVTGMPAAVAAATKPVKAPPPPPAKGRAAASDSDDGSVDPDLLKDGDLPPDLVPAKQDMEPSSDKPPAAAPEYKPIVPQLPKAADSGDVWLKFARSNGIALSPEQKKANKKDLVLLVKARAMELDAQHSEASPEE